MATGELSKTARNRSSLSRSLSSVVVGTSSRWGIACRIRRQVFQTGSMDLETQRWMDEPASQRVE